MPDTDSTTVEATRPALTRRGDFGPFWRDAVTELATTDARPSLGVAVTAPNGVRIVPVQFHSIGNREIQGFLITHDAAGHDTGATTHPRPLIISTHGYNSRCNPVLQSRHATASGADLFCFDVRGFGRSRGAVTIDPRGWICTGARGPHAFILRGAVCDYIRAAEVGRMLQAERIGPVVFHGRSFGGGLAIMAQAVSKAAAYLAVSVPTFGWAAGRRYLVKDGSGRELNEYLVQHPEDESAVMETLTYFDTINFADRVGCPAIVGVGRKDVIVPAPTVYAIINHMTPRPEVVELPVSHSTDVEERHWVDFDQRWTDHVKALTTG